MHKRYMTVILTIIAVITMAGCANAGQTSPGFTPIFIDPTPQETPQIVSVEAHTGWDATEEPVPASLPASTILTITKDDMTPFGRGTSFVLSGNFSLTFPKEGRYYIFVEDNSILIDYGKASIFIRQTGIGPDDVGDMYETLEMPDKNMGNAAYNGYQFSYMSYSHGKGFNYYNYEYYFMANTDYFTITFDTRKGTDIGNEINDILNSIEKADLLPGRTLMTPEPSMYKAVLITDPADVPFPVPSDILINRSYPASTK